MGVIKPLSEKLISKIAAGEVIERPASVVKELIENSLDAKSKYIKVEIENGGLKKIQVTDDGIGMSKDDILECFKPHTTSKLSHEDDLFNINSMGFRGEALASISVVSNVVIKSRIATEISGNVIEVENGEIIRHSPIGMPIGTTVLVRNLFGKVPARKKFLKSTKTEFRHILDVVIAVALSNPNIGFFLAHDKRIILDLPGQDSVSDRIRVLLGREIYENLVPISFESDYHKISGYIAKPQISAPTRSKQYIYVNRRNISNDLISSAVKDSYGSLLMPREQPVFVLFFDIPPAMVDVNIHPRKAEVAFSNDNSVYEIFKTTIEPIIKSEDMQYSYDAYLKDAVEYDFEDLIADFSTQTTDEFFDNEQILQIQNLYLAKQTKNGMLLIDQHAAHERILYEQFLHQIKSREENFSKTFEDPILIELPIKESDALSEYLEIFFEMGFDISLFGTNTFKVSSVPFYLNKENTSDLIKDVLEDLLQGKTPKSLDDKTNRAISFMACRSAIKAGDYLTQEERLELFAKIEDTKTIYTCPHGRPVKMELSMGELDRLFKRKL